MKFEILSILFFANLSSSASIQRRGVLADGLTCNLARIRAAGGASDMSDAAVQLTQAAAGTAMESSAADFAIGAESVNTGISNIKDALLSGAGPNPAGATKNRGLVAEGLKTSAAALKALNANATTAGSDLADAMTNAQEALDDTIAAGKDVVANCPADGT